MIDVLQAIVGGILIFFAIGFVIVARYMKNLELWQKIIFSITISICISTIIAAVLGIFGIFTFLSFVAAYIVVLIAALAVSFIWG